jgi:TRAP-type C4-dicarboxylate transport system permease small subunit
MLIRAVARVLQVLVLVAMAVVATVVIVEVLLRYTLGQSLVITEELSRYLMIWVAFLGSVLVMRERGHIAAEGLCDWLGAASRRRVAVVADLLSLAFLLVVAVAGFQVLPAQLDQHLTTINVSIFWFYLAIPVGAGLMAVVVALRLLGWDRVEAAGPPVPEI